MKKKFVLILFFYLNFFNLSAFSNDKIVYLDIDFIMSNSKVGKYVNKKIEEIHKKNITSFKKMEDDLKEDESKIVKKRSVLSKEDFQKEISKLRAEVKDFRIKRKEAIDPLTQKRLESIQKLLEILSPILGDYAEENNISVIIDKKYIIVGKTELNVTNDILDLLDKKVKKINLD